MAHVINNYDINAQQIYGQITCASGFFSDYRCGSIIGTNLTETIYVSPGRYYTEYHMWKTNFHSVGGDSGGPVFFANYGMGITDATSGGDTYYSTVQWVESVMGASLCTTSSC